MRRVAYEGAVGGFGEPEAAVKPFFACSGIWKSFRKGGESRLVLPGVSVAIPRGGVLALIGASGCGKTTLLNILAGFDAPDAGTVTLEGRPCGGPGPDRAVVFQEPALFPWLTALENVEIAAQLCPDHLPAQQVLEAVGLGHRMDNFRRSACAGSRHADTDRAFRSGESDSGRAFRWPETAGFARSGIGPIAARTAHGRTVRRSGRHHA